MREFKPGDVAMWQYVSTATGRVVDEPQVAVRVPSCIHDNHSEGEHWHLSGGGWTSYDEYIRPLAVIDPEDCEQVERLAAYIAAAECGDGMSPRDALQAALREFADPKEPRPEEPQGLGAVVECEDGTKWIRHDSVPINRPWINTDDCSEHYANYADLNVVRVLSPGVTDA